MGVLLEFLLCPQGAGLATTNTSRVPLVLICIKLTTLMGLTWILTLMANWQHAAFLEYPSTVLNSMQGTYDFNIIHHSTKRIMLFMPKDFRLILLFLPRHGQQYKDNE